MKLAPRKITVVAPVPEADPVALDPSQVAWGYHISHGITLFVTRGGALVHLADMTTNAGGRVDVVSSAYCGTMKVLDVSYEQNWVSLGVR